MAIRRHERGRRCAVDDAYSSGYDHWLKAGKVEKRRGGAVE